MDIEIPQRLHPYSQLPGTYFMLPGTPFRLQIFPALIKVDDLSQATPITMIKLDVEGPVADFTVQQDLERGFIVVWGKSKKGYFRYKIVGAHDGASMLISIEKQNINLSCEGELTLHSQTSNQYILARTHSTEFIPYAPSNDVDRLFLGNTKSQDWSLMRRRLDLTQILPLWHRLGQLVPSKHSDSIETSSFLDMFLANFDFGMSPRLVDTDYQGIVTTKIEGSPLQILTQGAELIRSKFLQVRSDQVHILPELSPEFHCGRFLNVACESLGKIDLEWSKKAIRRAVFLATNTGDVVFIFYNSKTRCRLRTSHKDSGIEYTSGHKLSVIAGTSYWLDNFEK